MRRDRQRYVEVAEPSWQLRVIGALVFVSCTGAAAVEERPADVQQGHPYMPIAVGNTWAYATGQSHPSLEKMPGADSTEHIVAVEGDDKRRVARVATQYSYNASARDERSVVITPEGITPDIGTMTSAVGLVRTTATTGVYLPFDLVPGMRWTYTQEIDSPISTMSVSGSAEVVGTEKVSVPAGTFDAVLVRTQMRNHMVTKAQNGVKVPEIDHVQHDESYWVRGVGLVKNVTHGGNGYRAEKLLISYHVAGGARPVAPAEAPQDAPQIAVDPP